MTEPIVGRWRVVCRGPCGAQIYVSDTAPPTDAQQLLTTFADTGCPVGGTAGGCPNTTDAMNEEAERRPERLRQLVKAIRDRAPRSVRTALPALAAGVPVEVPVTWHVAMPDSSYSVAVTFVTGPGQLGSLHAAVKPGSLTPTGVVVHVAATTAVVAGQAGIHIIATQ